MALQNNRYYSIKTAGQEAVLLATTLLQSYPVTRACFGILGKKLLDMVGFGFFTDEINIITQGEQGKDLFMLCEETVDVLVDDKKVVQMDAPVLLGDKAIVEPESKRAATIKAVPGKTCFILKIPMGLFIRNFDDMTVEDASFSQEIGIFYNMFKGIQNRLFEYAFIQKNLWEEAVTTQTLAKTQKLVKILDNRQDEGWGESVWEAVRIHLYDSLKFKWPDGVPLDISTFRNLLRQHLDEKYPREAYKGKDSDYIKRKHQIWRKWLVSTSAVIMKELPNENNELDGNQIQLFNPRNYQIRIQGLIRAIEKRFLTSKIRDFSEGESSSTEADADAIKKFFGKTEKDNTFDLKSYLNSFEQKFKLKYPKRMQTQIAQRTALVAAKIENEFNESVTTIKAVIERNQSQLTRQYLVQPSSNPSNQHQNPEILPLINAVTKYYRNLSEPIVGKMGKVTYKHESTPSMGYLYKITGSKPLREELNHAIQAQVKRFNIAARLLTLDFIKNSFHLCEAPAASEIHDHDIERHYWMPLTKGVKLFAGDEELADLEPGQFIGGKGWIQEAFDEKGKSLGAWKFKISSYGDNETDIQNRLILVFPSQMFPWETTPRPNEKMFKVTHLPVMQWMINKQIAHIASLIPERDQVFENFQKTEQVVRLENKVKAFENTDVVISSSNQRKIIDFLKNVVGLTLDENIRFASNKLSKKIYNHILLQTKSEHPDLPAEQLGNQTYTKWRMILSEIIQITEQSEMDKSGLTAIPMFEIIENELGSILDSFFIPKSKKYLNLTGQTPYIQLPQILGSLSSPDSERHLVFELILSTLETYLRLLFEEIRSYKIKYDTVRKNKPQTDVQAMQTETILQTAARLKSIVQGKQAPTGSVAKSA